MTNKHLYRPDIRFDMGEFVVSGPWVYGYGVVVYVFINLYNKWESSSYVTPYINYEYYEAINYVLFFCWFCVDCISVRIIMNIIYLSVFICVYIHRYLLVDKYFRIMNF